MLNWFLNKLGYIRKSDVISDVPQYEVISLSETLVPIKPAVKTTRKKRTK